MRKSRNILLLLLVGILFLGSACQPKIYGRRKHRKDRNCGCEYVPAERPSSMVCEVNKQYFNNN